MESVLTSVGERVLGLSLGLLVLSLLLVGGVAGDGAEGVGRSASGLHRSLAVGGTVLMVGEKHALST